MRTLRELVSVVEATVLGEEAIYTKQKPSVRFLVMLKASSKERRTEEVGGDGYLLHIGRG